jgi:thymidylate synthase (FAD)
MASYCQESTRYCNYSNRGFGKQIAVIRPLYLEAGTSEWPAWVQACEMAEEAYFRMLDEGCTPQEARAVLPNSLKTEVIMTANLREWRHFFRLRTDVAAHPQMQEVALPLLRKMRELVPVVFDSIGCVG